MSQKQKSYLKLNKYVIQLDEYEGLTEHYFCAKRSQNIGTSVSKEWRE